MLHRADLRTLRNTIVHRNPAVFIRILNAWRIGAQDELIADATVQGNLLIVKNCALDDLDVGVRKFKPFRNASRAELLDFEIAEDGANIHWPQLDVHLDLETIRVVNDPNLQAKLRAERIAHDEAMGAAIKALRQREGLRQADIAGISGRQVRRIEKGETSPRTDSLRRFAEAHSLSLNEYLNALSQEMRRIRSATDDGPHHMTT